MEASEGVCDFHSLCTRGIGQLGTAVDFSGLIRMWSQQSMWETNRACRSTIGLLQRRLQAQIGHQTFPSARTTPYTYAV